MNVHVSYRRGNRYDLRRRASTTSTINWWEPFREIHDAEPRTTGNHGTSKRAEKASIKKLVNGSRFLLPVHDRPCKIEGGYVVGRLQDQSAGPIVQSLPKRSWFPA